MFLKHNDSIMFSSSNRANVDKYQKECKKYGAHWNVKSIQYVI